MAGVAADEPGVRARVKTIADLRELLARATPLPWFWGGNTEANWLGIASGASGRPYVMMFRRWGMRGATPTFAVGRDPKDPAWTGLMTRACELARYQVLGGQTIAEAGHEPYRYDVVGIDSPDAELLVEAVNALPALLANAETLASLRERALALRADPDFTEMCEAGFPELTALLDEAARLVETVA